MHVVEVKKSTKEIKDCRNIPLIPVSNFMANYRVKSFASFLSNRKIPYKHTCSSNFFLFLWQTVVAKELQFSLVSPLS